MWTSACPLYSLSDAASEKFALAHGLGRRDGVEGADHPDHGPEQAEQRADLGDAAKQAEMPPELIGDSFPGIENGLFDFH